MIQKDNFSMLHTRPEDEGFHRSRRMFVIKNGGVEVGPKNVKDSHLEWLTKEGWVTKETAEDFMKTHIRGFYLDKQNAIYCYRGLGFGFDDKVKHELLDRIGEVRKALGLDNEAKVYLGPRDTPLYGIDWPTVYLGNVKELINKEEQ